MIQSPDHVPAWVHGSINDEMKLATAFGLAHADEPMRGAPLSKEIDALQNGAIGFSEGSPQQFCGNVFQPASITQVGVGDYLHLGRYPRQARTDELTAYGKQVYLPVAGDVGRWSINQSELTLRQTLGATAMARSNEHSSHTSLRIHMFNALLGSAGSLPVSKLIEPGMTPDDSRVSSVIQEMESEGILEHDSSEKNNTRTFEILTADYAVQERQRPYEKLKPESKFMHRTLKIAQVVKDIWELDEFLALAKAVDGDEQLNVLLRAKMQHNLAPSIESKQPYIRNVSGPKYGNGQVYTEVALSDKYAGAISELVGLVNEHTLGSATAKSRGLDAALEIIVTPENMATLVAKSRKEYSLVEKDTCFAQSIADIVGEAAGASTLKDVHTAYEAASGRKISLQTVNIALWKLAKADLIQKTAGPGKTRTVGKQQFYSRAQ